MKAMTILEIYYIHLTLSNESRALKFVFVFKPCYGVHISSLSKSSVMEAKGLKPRGGAHTQKE